MVKVASDVNHVLYCSIWPNYWRKQFSVTRQTFTARLITHAYLAVFDIGGGNLERDSSSARAVIYTMKTSICHNEIFVVSSVS